VDIRFIVATNKDLEEAISNGKFREDLYYRLNVVSITIPPLRERKEDIPDLVSYFLKKFNRELKRGTVGITPSAMEKINSYEWPGNVRQLENVLKRAGCSARGSGFWRINSFSKKGWEKREAEEELSKKNVEGLLDTLFEELSNAPASPQDLDMISNLKED